MTEHIPGPSGPIRMKRDVWGYPTVWVHTLDEGAYARGYLHAMDRLVQIHISLMGGQGRMMELLGDVPVARMLDRAIRALDFVSDLDTHVEQLDTDTRRMLQAYCDGFNRALQERSHPLILHVLGLPPLQFELKHVLLMYRFVAYFGLTSMHHLAEGVIAEMIGNQGITDEGLEILLGDSMKGFDRDALQHMHFPEAYAFLQPPPRIAGSNAFAVDAQHSASGGALLMGEFHMEVGRFPPILYAVHTQYQNGDFYSGIGIPGLAWLSAARTQHVGWSYTFGHAENVDTLVERCKNGMYQAGDTWHPLQHRIEIVHIKDQKEPERWSFFENEYGTVLGNAMEEGDYPCVRWSGLRTSTATDINATRKAIVTQNVHDFTAFHRDIRMLSLSAVAADSQGEIAYIQTGQVDQKPKDWTGTTPRHAHDLTSRTPEPMPEEGRPFYVNPPEGFLVSANEQTDGPNGDRWCQMPEPPYRHERITALLQGRKNLRLEDLVRISYDEVDLCARRMMKVWRPLLPQNAETFALYQWAMHHTTPPSKEDRKQLGLFYALHYEVVSHLLRVHMGPERTQRFLDELGLLINLQHYIDPVIALEKPHLLDRETLREWFKRIWPLAYARSRSKDWPYPPKAPFKNAITQGELPSWLGFSSVPIDLPGSPVAPFQSRIIQLQGQTMVAGPAFHICFDMKQPQGAWYNMAGGASESRLGPGYGKGIEAWQQGRFEPLGSPSGKAPDLHWK